MAGLDRAKAQGKTLGRRRLVFDRSKVTALRNEGKSINQICEALNLSHGTVQRALAN